MGTGSKVFSVILRFGELCSSVIVVALLGRFYYLLHLAPSRSTEGRLIYTQVISCLALLSSIILIIPLAYSFYAWPLDAILFVCSMVAFGLMADINSSCSSYWYWNYWGYYWGRFWTVAPRAIITFSTVGDAGCGTWRAILAFLFIGSIAWLLSSILGLFISLEIYRGRATHRMSHITKNLTREKRRDVENSNDQQQ